MQEVQLVKRMIVSGAKVQLVQSWLKILRLNAALVLIKLTLQNTFENVRRK